MEGYYSNIRPEVVALIPPGTKRLLDVGCGEGKMSAEAKRLGVAEAYGIEALDSVAKKARAVLDDVLISDIETAAIPWSGFDCIVCADVLEHLRDPWATLRKLRALLSENGVLIASIPNIAHFSVVLRIIRDRFAYEDDGILDRTHLRFFTKHTVGRMFADCGYRIAHLGALRSNSRSDKLFSSAHLGDPAALLCGPVPGRRNSMRAGRGERAKENGLKRCSAPSRCAA